MAIQILPHESSGEQLGQAFGTGLQQALGMLVKNKLEGLRGAQEYQTLQSLLGRGSQQYPQGASQLAGIQAGDRGVDPRMGVPSGYIRPGQAPQLASVVLKQQAMQQKAEQQDTSRYDKLMAPIVESAHKAHGLNSFYDTMLELNELANVPRGAIPAVAEKLGVPTSVYGDTIAETLDKMLKGNVVRKATLVGKAHGAGEKLIKVLSEVEGSLKNSKEGLRALIKSQKALETGPEEIRAKVADQLSQKIYSEGKILPKNFLSLVDNEAEKETAKLFKENLKQLRMTAHQQTKQSNVLNKYSGDAVEDESGKIYKWNPEINRYEEMRKRA